jgi:DNA invertase Pin-like site-specific DNA recombinase
VPQKKGSGKNVRKQFILQIPECRYSPHIKQLFVLRHVNLFIERYSMKKACLFVRVSSVNDRQDYNRQIIDLNDYCEKQELEITYTIAEKISGAKKNDERPGIKELRELARKKAFEVLLVSEISRLGRNPFQIQQVIEELSESGISIHIESLGLKTIDENGQRSPLVEFMLSILMQLSRMEREFLIQRMKSGLNHAKAIGKTLESNS